MPRSRGRPPKVQHLGDRLFGVSVGGRGFVVKLVPTVVTEYAPNDQPSALRAAELVMEEVLSRVSGERSA